MESSARPFPTRAVPLRSGRGGGWPLVEPPGGLAVRRARAVRRSVLLVAWTLVAILPQLLLIRLPGRAKIVYAQLFWAMFCRLFGVRVRVLGSLAASRGPAAAGRRVLFVANHSSWLDVAVLGGRLPACFVSKDVVRNWPLVNLIAWLGRTVYVSRQRGSTGRERAGMHARLVAGDNLILFPEGTTSDGSRVLPFHSSFLAVAKDVPTPLVQPVSVVYDRLGFLPAGRQARPLSAYYGDMAIGPHFWRLAQWSGLRATVLLHPPLDPDDFADRKQLSRAIWGAVADGAALLRQNRQPPELTS